MKYTVDEFEGDVPLEKNARDFDNLHDAKSFAREWFTKRDQTRNWKRGVRPNEYHIDVFCMETGTCFLMLPGRLR